jgi:hypothetical protein
MRESYLSWHDYAPFGEELFAGRTGEYRQDSVRQQFTGQERDRESGLDGFDEKVRPDEIVKTVVKKSLGGASSTSDKP